MCACVPLSLARARLCVAPSTKRNTNAANTRARARISLFFFPFLYRRLAPFHPALSLCFSLRAVNPNKGNRIAKPIPAIRSLPESSYERFIRQRNVLLISNSSDPHPSGSFHEIDGLFRRVRTNLMDDF